MASLRLDGSFICGASLDRARPDPDRCALRHRRRERQDAARPPSRLSFIARPTKSSGSGGETFRATAVTVHESYNGSTADGWDVARRHASTARPTQEPIAIADPPRSATRGRPAQRAASSAGATTRRCRSSRRPPDRPTTCRRSTSRSSATPSCNATVGHRRAHPGLRRRADGGKDSCQGDSGGPLMAADAAGKLVAGRRRVVRLRLRRSDPVRRLRARRRHDRLRPGSQLALPVIAPAPPRRRRRPPPRRPSRSRQAEVQEVDEEEVPRRRSPARRASRSGRRPASASRKRSAQRPSGRQPPSARQRPSARPQPSASRLAALWRPGPSSTPARAASARPRSPPPPRAAAPPPGLRTRRAEHRPRALARRLARSRARRRAAAGRRQALGRSRSAPRTSSSATGRRCRTGSGELLVQRGVDRISAEELTVPPGLDELFSPAADQAPPRVRRLRRGDRRLRADRRDAAPAVVPRRRALVAGEGLPPAGPDPRRRAAVRARRARRRRCRPRPCSRTSSGSCAT